MKTYLNILAAMTVLVTSSTAGAANPSGISFYEDFSKMGVSGDALPTEWVTYGNGEVPAAEWQEIFGTTGEGPYYRVMNVNGRWGAFSNSSFIEDVESDEWLVTPFVRVNTNDEILLMTVTGYGAAKSNDFMVFLSETGNTKESFTEAPVVVSNIYGSSVSIKTRQVAVRLQGYAGKDIYLAFVNRSKDSALLGLNEIYIAPYTIKVTNMTQKVVTAGSAVTVSLSADVRTTQTVNGMKVVLTTSDGNSQTMELNQKIALTGKHFNITFPDPVTVGKDGVKYTVSFTPDFEGAVATEITGEIQTPRKTYTPVAVVEELTGSWCGWCPRGAAFLEYYADKYNDENGRVYGIAVHGMDLMTIEDGQYLSNLQTESNSAGYPHAFFQRSVGSDPGSPEVVEEILKQPCYSAINIDEVDFKGNPGDALNIKFSVESAYNKEFLNQRAAFVLIEDKVRSYNPDYSQANNFSGLSKAVIEKNYGSDLWPYFRFYCQAPKTVPAARMEYNHVARGIYPNYYGMSLEGSCEALVPQEFSIDFVCPDNVMNTDNLAVVALLIDNDTNKIITASRMNAADFIRPVGISGIADDGGIEISNENGALNVSAPEAVTVDVYAADGTLIERCEASDGLVNVPAERFNGIIIVRANTANGSAVKKMILK